ncbi:MAG: hypothetical protein H6814_00510 [Phycisphaeraceae bacterium]|nr:hypothetical protein [Phycisphaeraceae bacterium]
MSSTISPNDSKREPAPTGIKGRLAALLALTLLYALLVVPVILSGRGGTNEAGDAEKFHEPVIETMVEQWPAPDIVNYRSTTAPGYHLLMAMVMKATGARSVRAPVVRLSSALLTWLLVAAGFWWASSWCAPRVALALTLPLLLSPYVLGGGIWLTTDTAAWGLVALCVGGALATRRATPARTGLLALAATGAVAIRQIHAWTVAPLGLLALGAGPLRALIPAPLRMGDDDQPRSWARSLWGVAVALAPIALLLWFVSIWGGLTPPEYRDKHDVGANWATFPFALSLCGFFGLAFVPTTIGEVRRGALRSRWLWCCVALGLLVALLPATDWLRTTIDGVRWNPRDNGWLWKPVIQKAPDLFGRTSVVILLLAPLGAGVLWLLRRAAFSAGRGPAANVLQLTMLGWLLAQSMNSLAWQRYFEPMILLSLAWLAAMTLPPGSDPKRVRLTVIGALALAALQALLVGATLYREVLLQ